MPSLDREQQQVLSAIKAGARRNQASPMEQKAAIEIGLVESGLRNLSGGDRDSAGWRQERRSLYANPTNLHASVDRVYDEMRARRGKYGSAGALAAAVQRPAARYRGRYAQVAGQADALLGRPDRAAPSADAVPSDQSGGQQLAALLLAKAEPKQPRPSMGLAAPAFAAAPVMPVGAQQVASGTPRESPGASLASALTAIQGLQGPEAPAQPAEPSDQATPRQGGSRLLELFWQGDGGINAKNGQVVPQGFVSGHTDHVHVAAGPKAVVQLGKLAQKMGLHVGENPDFGGVAPVHVQNSYHYKGEAIDVSGDPAKMRVYAHRVASMYGLK